MAKLYFSYAAMNAGKSTMLLQAAYNYRERGMRALLLTSSLYAEGGIGMIRSRLGVASEAETFTDADDLYDRVRTLERPFDDATADRWLATLAELPADWPGSH